MLFFYFMPFQITVCPDECITKLHAQTEIKTSISLPDSVTDARVTKISESQCSSTWDWLESKLKTHAAFEVIYKINEEMR